MSYSDRFLVSDQYVDHVDAIIDTIEDPLIRVRYAGFVAVTAVTVFELAFKDILYEFADRKHKVFGTHIRFSYDKLNGRIGISDIRNNHVVRFGERYHKRFERTLKEMEKSCLASGEGSITSSYGNLVTWRHKFVHEGDLPNTATYDEARRSYFLGKKVLECLDQSLRR